MILEYDHPWKKLMEEFGPHTKVREMEATLASSEARNSSVKGSDAPQTASDRR